MIWTLAHQCFQAFFTVIALIFAVLTTQCIIFVFWAYLVLSEHWLSLQDYDANQWQQGIITMWTGSLSVTLKLCLLIGMMYCFKRIIKSHLSKGLPPH